MKTKMLLTIVAAVGALSLTGFAQDAGGPPQGGPPQGGPGGQGGKRPMPLLISALDANHDGVIDADEIAGASAALKKLDKNGDGKLSREEYMGKPPMGGRPPMGGQGGPEGQGGPGNDGPQGPPPGNQ